MANYIAQSKRLKPKLKCCLWCKNFDDCSFDFQDVDKRQRRKMLRENDYRYCKNYRYSKQYFKEWKGTYLENQRFYNEELGLI